MRGRKGVTLLELLMVVVIIGILGMVAIPQYIKMAEKGRMTEAMDILTAIRSAQARYLAEYGTYTNAAANLDFEATDAQLLGGMKFFGTLAITCTDCTTGFTASLVRKSGAGSDFTANSNCMQNYIVSLTHNGNWDKDCKAP